MDPQIIEISPERLPEYTSISIGYWVHSVFQVEVRDGGLGGLHLVEKAVASAYYKDYDTQEAEASPIYWPRQFDLTNWGLFLAMDGEKTIGGAAVALHTGGVNLLEDRDDLAVLWDIRVRPECRGRGGGAALFRYAVQWARDRGCSQLKIETQNVNVPACRFYARMGCELGMIHRFGYAAVPQCAHEAMLFWYFNIR